MHKCTQGLGGECTQVCKDWAEKDWGECTLVSKDCLCTHRGARTEMQVCV